MPATVSFRLVKVKVKDKWLVLATNLPRNDFSAQSLKIFYRKRWKIELAFRDIKHAFGALHFHSKNDLFNLQEFFAHLIRYNLTIRIIRQVRLSKTGKLKYLYKINFESACQIIQGYCRRALDYKKILKRIVHYVHPLGRVYKLFQPKKHTVQKFF